VAGDAVGATLVRSTPPVVDAVDFAQGRLFAKKTKDGAPAAVLASAVLRDTRLSLNPIAGLPWMGESNGFRVGAGKQQVPPLRRR